VDVGGCNLQSVVQAAFDNAGVVADRVQGSCDQAGLKHVGGSDPQQSPSGPPWTSPLSRDHTTDAPPPIMTHLCSGIPRQLQPMRDDDGRSGTVAPGVSTVPVTRHIRSRRIRQLSAIATKATPPSTTHRLSAAVSRPYQQRGRQAVSPGSCTATRPRCHAHRRPAVIRGDAKKRPCHRRRLEPEPSAPPAPLLGPGSSSRAPRWCRAARSRHRP
jgi:hypothetical protein